jgi:putative transposase
MIGSIDANRDRFGVEPICQVLPIAPSTYDQASRPLSARRRRDQQLKVELRRVHAEHFGVYGAGQLWRQLHREGIAVARCTVERLLGGGLHLQGVRRGKPAAPPRPMRPRRAPPTWWIATSRRPGPTSCGWPTHLRGDVVGFVCVGFIVDAFSRFVVGWQASRSLRTDLALGALEMASGAGRPGWRAGASLGQGRSIAVDSLHRTLGRGGSGHLGGLPRRQLRQCPGRDHHRAGQDRADRPVWPLEGLDEVEYATLAWVDWFNHRRLLEPIGHLPRPSSSRLPPKGGPSRTPELKDPSLR